MNLEMLLEESKDLKLKISEALTALKEWFEKKMDEAKEIFESIKAKISEKIKNVADGKLSRDIKDKSGKTILSKGDSTGKAVNKVKGCLQDIKTKCSEAISSCKEGIRSIGKNDSEKASKCKTAVKVALTSVGALVGTAGIIIGGIGLKEYNVGKKIAAKTYKFDKMAGVEDSSDVEERAMFGYDVAQKVKSGAKIKFEEFDFEKLMEEIELTI